MATWEAKTEKDLRNLEMTTLEAKTKEEHSFVIDYIGRKATTEIITGAVRYLDIPHADIANIQCSYRNDQTECNVQLLFRWYRNVGNVERPFAFLAKALKEVGGNHLTDTCFSKKQFNYEMGKLENKDLEESDVVKAVLHIRNFSSLVRYWGLAETALEHIKGNHPSDYRQQAVHAFIACLKRKLIEKRKDFYDGLVYIDEKTAIGEIEKIWSGTNTASM